MHNFSKKHVFMFFRVCSVFGVLGHALAAPGAPPGDPCILDFRQPLLAIMPISAWWTPSETIEAATAMNKIGKNRKIQEHSNFIEKGKKKKARKLKKRVLLLQ